ncbi:MAG TPA: hypothetical protein PKB01_00585 [Xanthobacteraceae bacterium]|nr:hypothetical protein [Xanthobacteraceae bacterium]
MVGVAVRENARVGNAKHEVVSHFREIGFVAMEVGRHGNRADLNQPSEHMKRPRKKRVAHIHQRQEIHFTRRVVAHPHFRARTSKRGIFVRPHRRESAGEAHVETADPRQQCARLRRVDSLRRRDIRHLAGRMEEAFGPRGENQRRGADDVRALFHLHGKMLRRAVGTLLAHKNLERLLRDRRAIIDGHGKWQVLPRRMFHRGMQQRRRCRAAERAGEIPVGVAGLSVNFVAGFFQRGCRVQRMHRKPLLQLRKLCAQLSRA